jgi:hypothetical protein
MKCQMKPMDFSSCKTGEIVFNSQAIEDDLTAAKLKKGTVSWGVMGWVTNKCV